MSRREGVAIVILTRILIIIGIILGAFFWLRYLFNPRRKLELAHERGETYLLDTPDNVRKNFLLTHKRVLFEGEKYLGTTDQAFVVTQIYIWAHTPSKLKGFQKEDFYEMERIIRNQYPEAEIEWKSPIKEFLRRDN